MSSHPRKFATITLLILLVMVSGCARGRDEAPAETPKPTLHPTFTPTLFVPTATPTEAPPTPTPEPTAIPEVIVIEPTATPVVEPPASTPEPEPPTPTPQAAQVEISGATVNFRSGPGTNYNRAGQASRGQKFDILAKNQAGDWWQITASNGQTVWIINNPRFTQPLGDTSAVAVAENIPAPPPTARPRPTQPPPPTNTPAPSYVFSRTSNESRPNTNPIVTFYGGLYNRAQDLRNPVSGGYKMVVISPHGEQKEMAFGPYFEHAFGGLPSEFLYNAKIEFPSADGVYRVFVADGGGTQVSEFTELSVSGETRTFIPRWREN